MRLKRAFHRLVAALVALGTARAESQLARYGLGESILTNGRRS